MLIQIVGEVLKETEKLENFAIVLQNAAVMTVLTFLSAVLSGYFE